SEGNNITLQGSGTSDHLLWSKIQVSGGEAFVRKGSSLRFGSPLGWGAGDPDDNVIDIRLVNDPNSTFGANKWILSSATCPGGTTTTVNCNSVEGFFDTADCGTLSGWAYDATQPNTPINVDLYEGSTLIQANIAASNFRQDLQNAGKGNGVHGFSISTPSSLKNGTNRSISFRISGCTYTLSNSPKNINCAGGGARIGVYENISDEGLELIASPNPNNGEFQAAFYLENGQKADLTINDILGRKVWQKTIVGQGEHKELVSLPSQSAGSYILLLQKETTKFSKSAVKAEYKKVIVVK
ncbi:T9SS type A sorting domain-containing protein, partial [Persicitalea sp.]|uniref:T9SS type A sorting domain-containing protein n=1 Tax=Persicitalea sp. TaxID=3100273 RepID=UPI003593646A